MYVAVVGEGEASQDLVELAEEVGFQLARRGCGVVCGGLAGVMEGACRGAKRAGGLTIGILPGDRREAANPFVDVRIATGMGEARNVVVVKTADAVIAVGGRYGTLSEIGLALKTGKPVVGLRSWGLSRDGEPDTGMVIADSSADAVDLAVSLGRAAG